MINLSFSPFCFVSLLVFVLRFCFFVGPHPAALSFVDSRRGPENQSRTQQPHSRPSHSASHPEVEPPVESAEPERLLGLRVDPEPGGPVPVPGDR